MNEQPQSQLHTILLQDGEICVGPDVMRQLQPNLVTLSEKKSIFEKFVAFLQDPCPNVDVLQVKYDFGSAQFLRTATTARSLLGLLAHLFATGSAAVRQLVLDFSADESLGVIQSHVLFDFYCFVRYDAGLEYGLYRGKWDVLLGQHLLQAKIDGRNSVSDRVLAAVLHNTNTVD